MKFPSLFELFQGISDQRVISRPNLADELRRLLQHSPAADGSPRFKSAPLPSSLNIDRAQDRVHHWAHKNGISTTDRAYNRAGCENTQIRTKNEWEEMIRTKLSHGLELDAAGELLAAAKIGREVYELAKREHTLFTKLARLTARQLITHAGEVMSIGAPGRIRPKLRAITKHYYEIGETTLCASSRLTEAMHVRTQAIVCGNSAALHDSIVLADQAEDFLLASANPLPRSEVLFRYHQILYVQSRILTDAGQHRQAAEKLSQLIGVAATMQDERWWIDPMRGLFSHLHCLDYRCAAEVILASLCYYFDRVIEPSVFTFLSILLRLSQHAAMTDRYHRELDRLFFHYWHDNPQAYFWARFRALFEDLNLCIGDEQWLDVIHPMYFASRCANLAKDRRLIP